MLKKTDLEEIATEVSARAKVQILQILEQKEAQTLFDPARLVDFEKRLKQFIFEELCTKFLGEEDRNA